MRESIKLIVEILRMAALALVVVLPIRYFLFQPFIVSGSSMSPNFEDGDYLIIDELSYRFRSPIRGEVIIFYAPPHPSSRYIKRIIGLPGEKIVLEQDRISIFKGEQSKILNEEEYMPRGNSIEGETSVVLGEDEYFVLGDNRGFSSDSRTWGALERKHIVGRAVLRLLPISQIKKFSPPLYSIFGCPAAAIMAFREAKNIQGSAKQVLAVAALSRHNPSLSFTLCPFCSVLTLPEGQGLKLTLTRAYE